VEYQRKNNIITQQDTVFYHDGDKKEEYKNHKDSQKIENISSD